MMSKGRPRNSISNAALFIVAVSRWGPWWADPANKYPHIPQARSRTAGKMPAGQWGPFLALIIVIIGIAMIAFGEVPMIPCAPILVVVAIVGVIIFLLRPKPHHKWEKPPRHRPKKAQ